MLIYFKKLTYQKISCCCVSFCWRYCFTKISEGKCYSFVLNV